MFVRSRRAVACLVLPVLVASLSTAVANASPPPFVISGGVSRPVFDYGKAVRESVWVETGQDHDRDGEVDRVAADVIRPSEPAARGQRIPVIMEVSPYFACCGRGNERQLKTYGPDGRPEQFPLFLDNYFVPRGYGVVLVDVAGTNRSTGCFDDVASGLGVVDWLNGRAKGYRTVDGDQRVEATWANGDVGAYGKSQDGAAANGMAVTGIEGLKTIVPVAAVSSYYYVNNSNGAWFGPSTGGPGVYNPRAAKLCVPYEEEGARLAGTSGDYNAFYRAQDFVPKAHRVRASVFAVHGFHDLNVRPIHFGPWWEALGRAGVTRKAWLNQAGHVDAFDLRRPEFVTALHRWFDRWLLGVRNGIEREPMIHIEHAPDRWVDERSWPAAGTRDRTLWTALGGALSTDGPARSGTAQFTDDHPEVFAAEWAANPDQPSGIRAVFRGKPLTAPMRLSGTPSVTVKVRSDKPSARIGALLVDYGPATVRNTNWPKLGIKDLTTRSCWGASSAVDSACYLDTEADLVDVDRRIIATSWADIGHHRTLARGEELTPGKAYTMTFPLGSLDHVVPAGHRVGLVIGGTDGFWFTAPTLRPTLTFDLSGTSVSLPVAPSR